MQRDLSCHHEPVSDMFPRPTTRDDWDRYRLSDEQVTSFAERGYVAGVPLLNVGQIERLRSELIDLFDSRHPSNDLFYEYHSNESASPETVLFHALGAWRLRPALHDILWAPAFTMAASQLLGGKVRFWHDQLFCKPPKHGGVVAWH